MPSFSLQALHAHSALCLPILALLSPGLRPSLPTSFFLFSCPPFLLVTLSKEIGSSLPKKVGSTKGLKQWVNDFYWARLPCCLSHSTEVYHLCQSYMFLFIWTLWASVLAFPPWVVIPCDWDNRKEGPSLSFSVQRFLSHCLPLTLQGSPGFLCTTLLPNSCQLSAETWLWRGVQDKDTQAWIFPCHALVYTFHWLLR